MVQGITNKAADLDVLKARAAELEAQVAERDAQLAWMTDELAQVRSAEATAVPEPTAKAASAPDPVVDARKRRDAELGGLAIVAKATPGKGTRATWHAALEDLGRHLAPDLPPTAQLQKALRDDRGRAFLEAKMAAPQ